MSTSPLSSTFNSAPFHEASAPEATSGTNTHPYAIKSSSSGILTRTNSVPNPSTHHHYVPIQSARPIKGGHKKRRYVPSKTLNVIEGTDQPPAHGEDTVLIPTTPIGVGRVKRRDTLPFTFTDSGKAAESSKDVLKDLPINPKQWTPFELATYLSSTLRLRGGATLPSPVMRDVTSFVVKQRLDGRMFLKMTPKDYSAYDINPLWKEALMNASLTLRQNLLQGQVFGSLKASALSAEDLSLLRETEEAGTITASPSTPGAYIPWDRRRTLGKLQTGKVKVIAHKYERSYSDGETSPVHTRREDSLERSGSESDDASASSTMNSPVERSVLPEEAESTGSPLLGNETAYYREEPTVEELINTQDQPSALWGAKAWEEEDDTSSINVTARKITREDGSAEEILDADMKRKRDRLPETLASLFSGAVSDIVIDKAEPLQDAVGNAEGSNEVSEERAVPIDPISPSLKLCNDIDTSTPEIQYSSVPDPPHDLLSESSSSPSDVFPISLENSVVISPQQTTEVLKAEVSAMTENANSVESLQEMLQALRNRLEVVEKRLFELETPETAGGYYLQRTVEERSLETNIKPKLNVLPHPDHPTTFVAPTTDPVSRSNTKRDVIGEDIDHHKSSSNYSSDFSVYSYVFYASIGLAAMVLDRTFFGRK